MKLPWPDYSREQRVQSATTRVMQTLQCSSPLRCSCYAMQDVVNRLTQLLKPYSDMPELEHIYDIPGSTSDAPASTASSSGSATAVAPHTADSASRSDALQARLPSQFAFSMDMSGEGYSGVGLLQNIHPVVQPMLLASLLSCLPRNHTFSPAEVFACTEWFTTIAGNMFLDTAQNEQRPAIYYVTPYLHMMRECSSAL